MAFPLRTLTGLFVFISMFTSAPALIVGNVEGTEKGAISHSDPTSINDAFLADGHEATEFPYWNNVGMVGHGTGTYIGDGWVITAAHVGCFPFVTADGKVWKPLPKTYRLLKSSPHDHGDVAIFQVEGRPELPAIPLAKSALDSAAPGIIVGNGYTQESKAEPLVHQGRVLGNLGYYTRPVRAKLWGRAYLSNDNTPTLLKGTKGTHTHVVATRFERKAFASQATDGDSGSPAFSYNAQSRQWELAGCVAAVSHKTRYVPHGSNTFIATLPVVETPQEPVAKLDHDLFVRPAG